MKKVYLFALSLLLFSCTSYEGTWMDSDSWLQAKQDFDTSFVDVFYIVSTNVIEDTPTHLVTMDSAARADYEMEMRYIREAMGDSVNFISPFYHQIPLAAYRTTEDSLAARMEPVYKEVREAFGFYYDHLNRGRDFVLMGFSQGAMIVLDLTKHLTAEQSSHLVASYLMGYRLTAEDTLVSTVRPAHNATERGVTVSFNTVRDTTSVWPLISDGAVTVINPLNWTTDGTSATLIFGGDTTSVYADTEHHVLLAPGIEAEKYYKDIFKPFCEVGNLHLGDLLFYLPSIRENIHQRR